MAIEYFGTDGIRGRAFEPPLTLEETCRWGSAWAKVAKRQGIQNLVIGWDGRTSCTRMLQAFLAGCGAELKTLLLGIVPTPAVAWVTSTLTDTWGLMISASHNPPEDNGLKGFDSQGVKLAEDIELAIETAFIGRAKDVCDASFLEQTADLPIQADLMEAYLAHIGSLHIPDSFPVIIDCAHGANASWAQRLFSGAVHWIGTPTIGEKINVNVGSNHLDTLRSQLLSKKAALGVAFDGDGDRCLMLDDKGEVVDGDQMVMLLALDLQRQGNAPPGVIGTIMSNGGLEQRLDEMGIPFVRTPVGDKYMVRELIKSGWDLAAEASGHLIQRHVSLSGDGLATALSIIKILIQMSAEDRWGWCFAPWPLNLVNLKVKQRKAIEECAALQRAINEIKAEHGDSIRLVVRWSGTEPLLRIMAEAKEGWQVEWALKHLTSAATADLLP